MKIKVVVDTVLTRVNLELSGLGTLLKNTTLISYKILDKSVNKDHEAHVKLILC